MIKSKDYQGVLEKFKVGKEKDGKPAKRHFAK